MSDFSDNHITARGSELLASVLAGGSLTFTRVVMGDGMMPSGQTPATMTDVISPRAEASITKCSVIEGGQAVVGARFSNEGQPSEFVWRELGLYARGSDGAEVLYSYGHTPQGELIPASGATAIEKLVDVVTYVGDAGEVTAVFDPRFVAQVERITEEEIYDLWGASPQPPGEDTYVPMTEAEVEGLF